MITIVDYGRGNLFSLGQALRYLGFAYQVSSNPEELRSAEIILFPGVGAFGDAMHGLRTKGLVEPLIDAAARGIPILGICVGCQLLLTRGEEFGDHAGLGLIPGTVARLPAARDGDPEAIRIPNVGWRNLKTNASSALAESDGKMAYFVHSYAPMVENLAHVMATIAFNGQNVPVAIRCGNVTGFQFHPEKSGPVGLAILKRFLETKSAS